MFSNLFDNLIMTDSLAKELERFNTLSLERLNALSRKEKEEPKKTKTTKRTTQKTQLLQKTKPLPKPRTPAKLGWRICAANRPIAASLPSPT